MGIYLIYPVNEGLGITPRETLYDFNLIAIREYPRYQISAFVHGKVVGDQKFPIGEVTGHSQTGK